MAPIDTLIEWFDTLPPEMKHDATARLFESIPSELTAHLAGNDAPTFAEQAHRWSEGTPSQHVGAVLMLAGAIDLLLEHQGTEEDWAEHKSILEEVERVANVKGFATRSLQQLPKDAAVWIKATAQWRQLRETSLSIASLSSWIAARDLESYLGDELDPDLDDEM